MSWEEEAAIAPHGAMSNASGGSLRIPALASGPDYVPGGGCDLARLPTERRQWPPVQQFVAFLEVSPESDFQGHE